MNCEQLSIRSLHVEDYSNLFDLHNNIFIDRKEINSQFQQWLNNAVKVWGVACERQLVGYTAVWQVPGLDDLLEMNGGILPEYRRQGIGTTLLHHVISDCRPLPFHTLSFPVDELETAVAQFLQQHNFWVEHEEWTMELNDLTKLPDMPSHNCQLKTVRRKKAIDQFITLYNDSFANTPWNQPFSADEVAQMLNKASDIQFLIENDKAVGFVWLHFSNPNRATIEPIGVSRDVQGKGYGRILLTTILHKLAQQNIQTVSLGVWANNHKAISLYESVGFQHTDTVTYFAVSLEE